MKKLLKIILISVVAGVAAARAANLDTIGVTLLRATTTNLNGAGIRVAQPEAGYDLVTNWEVNPVVAGQPASLFTYISADGSTGSFPNSLSSQSDHADSVAENFYGIPTGAATNVAHVDNFDANFFYSNDVANLFAVNDAVINQSYIFGYVTNGTPVPPYFISVSDQQSLDSQFDDYAAQFGTFFVSGIGNGGAVDPPATCYNGIGVGAYGGGSSTGPTLDNGRCKPDLVAPESETSFSTPFVAGAAAILMQAGLRSDGGADTNSAVDLRTMKALLLNGAVKPGNWTNSNSSPLDARYGAGVLNIFNSYEQLAGGKQANFVSDFVSANTAHPPIAATNFISALSAWDFNTNSSGTNSDGVNHYFFNVTNIFSGAQFAATATLIWNRQLGQTNINNLDLFLYNCASSNLVACSTSLVDNVEHIFVPKLPQGRYDLQVWKAGGDNIVSTSETYALAWEFSSTRLAISKSGTNANLSWPVYPAGFAVAAATNLTLPVWSTNNLPLPVFTNNQNFISIPVTNAVQFFRLRTPNF